MVCVNFTHYKYVHHLPILNLKFIYLQNAGFAYQNAEVGLFFCLVKYRLGLSYLGLVFHDKLYEFLQLHFKVLLLNKELLKIP